MATNICEKVLTACIGASCDNPIFSGIEQKAWIFNKSEIASFTTADGEPNLYTAITMKTHEVNNSDVAYTGYTVQQLGKTPFTGTVVSMQEGNVANKFNSVVAFTVPDNSPTAAKILDMLKDGKFVVVLANDYEGSDNKGKYQVFGSKKGLSCTAIENDKYSEDTDGGWAVTLTEENGPVSAMFIQHMTTSETPVDDTATYLDTLVSCE